MNNPTTEIKERLQQMISENPNRMLGELAGQLGINEAEAIYYLPEEMRTAAPTEDFESIWQEACCWEKVTFIAVTPGAVVEYMGKLPTGSHGHGMYNLHQEGIPLGGHLMIKQLGSIWFLSKPHFGKESHSIQFYSTKGQPMFSLYVGRGADKELLPEVLEKYNNLRSRYEEAV